MAIRQLLFDIGENLGIRQKGNRLIESDVLENLKKNLESKEQLIVKCGKSFWDVTAYPEIFEEGTEFTVDDLTSIDRKQMAKKEPPKPAFEDDATSNPLAALYHKTDEEEEDEEPERLERRTYYLRPKDIEALTILCHETRVELSAMVREIFERGIGSIAEELECGDIYARAESNLANGVKGKKKSLKKALR